MFVQYAQRGLEKLRESKDVLIQVIYVWTLNKDEHFSDIKPL